MFGVHLRQCVITKAVRGRQDLRVQSAVQGLVQLHELVREHAERPAIAHDVMAGDEKFVGRRIQARERRGHERTLGEIERRFDGGSSKALTCTDPSGSPVAQALGELMQNAPSFSLRGGTREILRGIIARGLDLR